MSTMTVTMMSAAVSVLQPAVYVNAGPVEASSRGWATTGRAAYKRSRQ